MLYSVDLTIPAGTTEASPTIVNAQLQTGVITRVRIIIPRGVAGLAFTRVLRGASPLWPSNPGGSFTHDGAEIEWAEDYSIDDEPVTLRLFGWSPSARFPHTLTWQFEMTTLDSARAVRDAPGLLRRIADVLIGRS